MYALELAGHRYELSVLEFGICLCEVFQADGLQIDSEQEFDKVSVS